LSKRRRFFASVDLRFSRVRQDLDGVQEPARVAVGEADQPIFRFLVELQPCPVQQKRKLWRTQRFQHVNRSPGEQCAVHLERRILGGRADEGQQALLDERQEGVLLRLVEAMHLVDEEDRRLAAARELVLRGLHRFADVLHAAEHRRKRHEVRVEGVRHQARERGLARSGRAPEDHRVRLAGLEGEAQRLARAEEVLLAYDLVDRLRPQTLRKRSRRLDLKERVHLEPLIYPLIRPRLSAGRSGIPSHPPWHSGRAS
jgi:hypothetical protein